MSNYNFYQTKTVNKWDTDLLPSMCRPWGPSLVLGKARQIYKGEKSPRTMNKLGAQTCSTETSMQGLGRWFRGESACCGMAGPISVLGGWVWQLSSNHRRQRLDIPKASSLAKLAISVSSGFDRDYVSENKVESDLEKVQKSASSIQQNMHTSTYHIWGKKLSLSN